MKKKYLHFRNYLSVLKENNITLKQLPFILNEWRLWVQIGKNFREIEGSWKGVIKRYIRMFENRP